MTLQALDDTLEADGELTLTEGLKARPLSLKPNGTPGWKMKFDLKQGGAGASGRRHDA